MTLHRLRVMNFDDFGQKEEKLVQVPDEVMPSRKNMSKVIRKQKSTSDLSQSSSPSKMDHRKRTLSLSDITISLRDCSSILKSSYHHYFGNNKAKPTRKRRNRVWQIQNTRTTNVMNKEVSFKQETPIFEWKSINGIKDSVSDFASSGDHFGFKSDIGLHNQYSCHVKCEYLNPFRKLKSKAKRNADIKTHSDPHIEIHESVEVMKALEFNPVRTIETLEHNPVKILVSSGNSNRKDLVHYNIANTITENNTRRCKEMIVTTSPAPPVSKLKEVTEKRSSVFSVLLNRRRSKTSNLRHKNKHSPTENCCPCRKCIGEEASRDDESLNYGITSSFSYERRDEHNRSTQKKKSQKFVRLFRDSIETYESENEQYNTKASRASDGLKKSCYGGRCMSIPHRELSSLSHDAPCPCRDCKVAKSSLHKKHENSGDLARPNKNWSYSAKLYRVKFGNKDSRYDKKPSVTHASAEHLIKCCCDTVVDTIKGLLNKRYAGQTNGISRKRGSSYEIRRPRRGQCCDLGYRRDVVSRNNSKELHESTVKVISRDKKAKLHRKIPEKYGNQCNSQIKQMSATPSSIKKLRKLCSDIAVNSSRHIVIGQSAARIFGNGKTPVENHERYFNQVENKVSDTPSMLEKYAKHNGRKHVGSSKRSCRKRGSSHICCRIFKSVASQRNDMPETSTTHHESSSFNDEANGDYIKCPNRCCWNNYRTDHPPHDNIQKNGNQYNRCDKKVSITPSSLERFKKFCNKSSSVNRHVPRRRYSSCKFSEITSYVSKSRLNEYGDAGSSESIKNIRTKNKKRQKYVRLFRDDEAEICGSSQRKNKKISVTPSSLGKQKRRYRDAAVITNILTRQNFSCNVCSSSIALAINGVSNRHKKKNGADHCIQCELSSSLQHNTVHYDSTPFQNPMKVDQCQQYCCKAPPPAVKRNCNRRKRTRLFQQNVCEDQISKGKVCLRKPSRTYHDNNIHTRYPRLRFVGKNSNMSICFKNALFVLIVIMWCPCVLALALMWAVTNPLKLHRVLGRASSKSAPMNKHKYQGHRTCKRRHTELPVNRRMFNEPSRACEDKGALVSFIEWSTKIAGNAASSVNAVFSSLKKERTNCESPQFRSTHPNPEKKYSLIYAQNRVMKPIPIGNQNKFKRTQIVQNMECDRRCQGFPKYYNEPNITSSIISSNDLCNRNGNIPAASPTYLQKPLLSQSSQICFHPESLKSYESAGCNCRLDNDICNPIRNTRHSEKIQPTKGCNHESLKLFESAECPGCTHEFPKLFESSECQGYTHKFPKLFESAECDSRLDLNDTCDPRQNKHKNKTTRQTKSKPPHKEPRKLLESAECHCSLDENDTSDPPPKTRQKNLPYKEPRKLLESAECHCSLDENDTCDPPLNTRHNKATQQTKSKPSHKEPRKFLESAECHCSFDENDTRDEIQNTRKRKPCHPESLKSFASAECNCSLDKGVTSNPSPNNNPIRLDKSIQVTPSEPKPSEEPKANIESTPKESNPKPINALPDNTPKQEPHKIVVPRSSPGKISRQERYSTKGILPYDRCVCHPAAGDCRQLRPLRFLTPSERITPCRRPTAYKVIRFPPPSLGRPSTTSTKRQMSRLFNDPDAIDEHSNVNKGEANRKDKEIETGKDRGKSNGKDKGKSNDKGKGKDKGKLNGKDKEKVKEKDKEKVNVMDKEKVKEKDKKKVNGKDKDKVNEKHQEKDQVKEKKKIDAKKSKTEEKDDRISVKSSSSTNRNSKTFKQTVMKKFGHICKSAAKKVQKTDADMWPPDYQSNLYSCTPRYREYPIRFRLCPTNTRRNFSMASFCRNLGKMCLYGATFICWSPLLCCFISCCQCVDLC